MNVFRKKISSLFIACLLFLSCCFPAQVYANSKTVQGEESAINIVTPDSFEELFGTSRVEQESNNRSITSTNDGVNYSYIFNRNMENENVADVNLTFVMNIADTSYWIETSGQVDLYELESGQTMWEGLIRGNANINNNECKVLVGFMKLEGTDEIKANVTLQPADDSVDFLPISFSFGDLVVSSAIKEESLEDGLEDDLVLLSSGVAIASTGSYVLKASSIRMFSNASILGEAQYIKAYFNDVLDRVALSIKSYTDHANDYYEAELQENATVSTSVKSFAMVFDRSGDATQIEGFDKLPNSSGSANNSLIKSIFEEIMSQINLPICIINAILDNTRGSYSYSSIGERATLNMSFATNQNVNFDDGELAVGINLDSGSSAKGKYIYTNNLTYRVKYYAPVNGTSYFYVDANQAWCTVSNLTVGN